MAERGLCGCLGKAVAAVLTVVPAAAVISLLFRIFILLLPLTLKITVFAVIAYLAVKVFCKIGETLRGLT